MTSGSYVAALDIGTTSIRCIILDSSAQTVGFARSSVKLIYPKPGGFEIEPTQLWETIVQTIKNSIEDAKLTPSHIKCLGVSTQRATFITWNKTTGKPFHNFIIWKDVRAKELCKQLNTSLCMKIFRTIAFTMYILTRSNRYLLGSRMKITSAYSSARLLWALQNVPELQKAVAAKNAMFGTIDTWLLHKFTKGALYVTDITNAAATGMMDPFTNEWGTFLGYFGVPAEILPEIVENDFNFGSSHEEFFGAEIPIRCVMADQSSSMFASCCFATDDIKITLGTGGFLNVNTDGKVHAGVTGIYPVVAWKLNNNVVNMGEVACNDCGSLVEWMMHVELIKSPGETFGMATSVDDCDGVYFIPAFSGLGAPINDERATSGFLGIKPTTTKNHLVRSILEGMIYRLVLAFQTLKKDRNREYHKVIIDGGVSQNDFICQMLADLTGLVVERLSSTELSALGVGFLAGVSTGIWGSYNELKTVNRVEKQFHPSTDSEYREKCSKDFNRWLLACDRFKMWKEEE